MTQPEQDSLKMPDSSSDNCETLPSSQIPIDRSNGKKPSLSTQQYETIGKTLMISEAACLCVGIPWLPPFANTRAKIRKFEGPLDEFIRLSLVCVSTRVLDSYSNDLDTIRFENESADALFIEKVPASERYASCGAAFLVLSATCLILLSAASLEPTIAVAISLAISAPSALVVAFPCLEIQRRASFLKVLNKELSRRTGDDKPTSTKALIYQKT